MYYTGINNTYPMPIFDGSHFAAGGTSLSTYLSVISISILIYYYLDKWVPSKIFNMARAARSERVPYIRIGVIPDSGLKNGPVESMGYGSMVNPER